MEPTGLIPWPCTYMIDGASAGIDGKDTADSKSGGAVPVLGAAGVRALRAGHASASHRSTGRGRASVVLECRRILNLRLNLIKRQSLLDNYVSFPEHMISSGVLQY